MECLNNNTLSQEGATDFGSFEEYAASWRQLAAALQQLPELLRPGLHCPYISCAAPRGHTKPPPYQTFGSVKDFVEHLKEHVCPSCRKFFAQLERCTYCVRLANEDMYYYDALCDSRGCPSACTYCFDKWFEEHTYEEHPWKMYAQNPAKAFARRPDFFWKEIGQEYEDAKYYATADCPAEDGRDMFWKLDPNWVLEQRPDWAKEHHKDVWLARASKIGPTVVFGERDSGSQLSRLPNGVREQVNSLAGL